MSDFGDMIRAWRGELSLSQAAAKIGCTKAHLWELEMGRSRNPTIKTIAGIAAAYDASVPYLAYLAAADLPDADTSSASKIPWEAKR